MRAIDADALLNDLNINEGDTTVGKRHYVMTWEIEEAPTLDVSERESGEWKITNTYRDHNGRLVDRVEHTECGYIWHREIGGKLHNFCPNCGADMRGEGE